MNARVSGRKPRASTSALRPSHPSRQRTQNHSRRGSVAAGHGLRRDRTGKPFPRARARDNFPSPKDWPHSRCLAFIAQTLRDVVRKFQPTVCAVEGLFFAQNLKTAIIMGEARRGAGGLGESRRGDIRDRAAQGETKPSSARGGAKLTVAKMVQRMLQLTELPDAETPPMRWRWHDPGPDAGTQPLQFGSAKSNMTIFAAVLHGKLVYEALPTQVIVDVNGVGYSAHPAVVVRQTVATTRR